MKIESSNPSKKRSSDNDQEMSSDKGDRAERGFFRRKRRPPVDLVLDYKDPAGLAQYISQEGKIVSARITGMSRKQQLQLTQEVKRARMLALLPIAATHSLEVR